MSESQPDAQPAAARPARRGEQGKAVHEVTFVSFPKLLFVWPIILAGIVLWPVAGWLNEGALETVGWVYLLLMVLVLLTLGVDVGRNQAVFWLVVIAAVWLLGRYLQDVKGFTLFGNIYAWFGALDVRYSRGFGLALSLVLLVPYVVMLVYAWLNDRWRITHNEFEHYSFGRLDDSLGRGAKTIRTTFPDVFELLLGLAGTLIVYNATGTRELRRIPHVMFLPFVRKRLNKILERTAITAGQFDDEEDDEEM